MSPTGPQELVGATVFGISAAYGYARTSTCRTLNESAPPLLPQPMYGPPLYPPPRQP